MNVALNRRLPWNQAVIFAALTISAVVATRSADAQTFELHTSHHPLPSFLTLELFLGTADDPLAVPLDSFGPLALQGSMQAHMDLDPLGSGTFTLLGLSMVMDSTSGTVTLDEFGTIDLDLTGFGFAFSSGIKPVTAHAFAFPFDETSLLVIDQGIGSLSNPTGQINDYAGHLFPYEVDFYTDPLTAVPSYNIVEPFVGFVDTGAGLASPQAEVQLIITSFVTPLIDLFGDDDQVVSVWVRLSGQMNAAAVPEPHTAVLLAIGTALALRAGKRRR